MKALVFFDGSLTSLNNLQTVLTDFSQQTSNNPLQNEALSIHLIYFDCASTNPYLKENSAGLEQKAGELLRLADRVLAGSKVGELEGDFISCTETDIPQILANLAKKYHTGVIYLPSGSKNLFEVKKHRRFGIFGKPAMQPELEEVPLISISELLMLTTNRVVVTGHDGDILRYSSLTAGGAAHRHILPAARTEMLSRAV